MEIQDKDGKRLDDVLRDGVVLLEEGKTYRIALQLREAARAGWRGLLGDLLLECEPDGPTFKVRPNFVGNESLHLLGPQGEQMDLPVEVLPRKTKLQGEAWAYLLRDLDAWLPGSTVGQEGGRHGDVGRSGCEIAGVASVLGDLVPAFISALEALMRAPRERSVEHWTEVPLHAVRQADRATLRWLAGHPDVYQSVKGYTEERRNGRGVLVPKRSWRGDLDHAANRYIAWLTRQVVRKLRETVECVQKGLRKKKRSLDPDLERWCEGRVERLVSGAETLEALLHRTPLGTLDPEPASDSASLTIEGDPVYGKVHALARIFLSPRFQLPEDEALLDAPVRPSYELYELWTFLALRRLLEGHLPGAVWTGDGLDKLRLFDQEPNGARYTARWAGRGELELHFNRPFPGYLTKRRHHHFCWSISGARRPDLVVTWKPDAGQSRWLCLDAKYRTEVRDVADAFESAHIYRDALRWRDMGDGGRCAGAVLLVPAKDPDAAPWFEKAFRDEHGAGVFCLTPGQPAPSELLEWLRVRLGLGAA